MESHSEKIPQPNHENNEQQSKKRFDEYYNQLTKFTGLGSELVYHQGFWVRTLILKFIISFQTQFEVRPTDLFIAGMQKTGNTWLKSLVFSISDRHNRPITNSLLLNHNPHELVPSPEFGYLEPPLCQGLPRLLSTHLPYEALPQSIKDSDCQIVYICRNPLDTFVSSWFFFRASLEKLNIGNKFPTMEEYFELYIQGITPFGPFFEHVLGYWKMSVELPRKVLFLKYEDLLKDTTSQLKKLAEFTKQPFSLEEEQVGVVEEIIKLCSIKNMKELKVNKEGKLREVIDNHLFFRKGETRDWANYLSPTMVDRMRELMCQKIHGTGLPVDDTWF